MDKNKTGLSKKSGFIFFVVPPTGVEPVLCCQKRILSPQRLPIPPRRQEHTYYNTRTAFCQEKTVRIQEIYKKSQKSTGCLDIPRPICYNKFRLEKLKYLLLATTHAAFRCVSLITAPPGLTQGIHVFFCCRKENYHAAESI